MQDDATFSLGRKTSVTCTLFSLNATSFLSEPVRRCGFPDWASTQLLWNVHLGRATFPLLSPFFSSSFPPIFFPSCFAAFVSRLTGPEVEIGPGSGVELNPLLVHVHLA